MTEAEYRSAADAFVSCIRNAGYTIGDPVLSPVDGLTLLYEFTFSGDPDVWNTKVEECNTGHVSHIEPTYVEARPQTMAPPLVDAMTKCLHTKGFTLRGSERNLKDFTQSTNDSGGALLDCVSATVRQVYPELPPYLKIRR